MAKKTGRKPPSHEVTIRRLEELVAEFASSGETESMRRTVLRAKAQELISHTVDCYIPVRARKKVADAVQATQRGMLSGFVNLTAAAAVIEEIISPAGEVIAAGTKSG